ncbi:MAG: Mur ligase family protein [Verrucomicrobiota bacterium]
MKTTHITALEGPNRYHQKPVLRVRFDAPEFLQKDRQCNKAHLAQALSAEITSFSFSPDSSQQSKSGLAAIDLLPVIALALQNLNGQQLSFYQSARCPSPDSEPAAFEIVYEYESITVARMAVALSFRILIAVLQRRFGIDFPQQLQAPENFDIGKQIDLFSSTVAPYQLDPTTRSISRSLETQHIPWHHLDDKHSIIQAGYGKERKLIQQSSSSDTSALGHIISQDPSIYHNLLTRSGFPLPKQALVTSIAQALSLTQSLSYPLIVKPASTAGRNAFTIKVHNEAELHEAFTLTRQQNPQVIIESFVSGHTYRLFVIGKQVAAITKKQLHPDNSDSHTALDCETDAHPDNLALAERCAAVIDLDTLSIDFISPDISRSYLEVGGSICAIQHNPELPPSLSTDDNNSSHLADKIVAQLFPGIHPHPGLIPLAAICGSNGKTTTCRMVDAILRQAGLFTGMANSDGIYVDGHLTVNGQHDGYDGARSILADSRIEAAVVEAGQSSILKQGLAFSACTVSAVLNITPDPVTFDSPDTLEGMADIKQVVAELARDTVVLNADDPLCIDMIRHLGGRQLSLVTRDPDNSIAMIPTTELSSLITLAQGKSSHVQNIVIHSNGEETPILKTLDIPATFDGQARHQVDNAMFAIAITFSMGIDIEFIQKGLRRFTSDFENNPGRCNPIYDKNFTVLIDFGNNPQAIGAAGELVENMENEGQRICILSAPPVLKPEHYLAMAEAAADSFDHIICSNGYGAESDNLDHVPSEFEQALNNCGFDADEITLCPDPDQSIQKAIKKLANEDILVIFGDQPKRRRQVALEALNPL